MSRHHGWYGAQASHRTRYVVLTLSLLIRPVWPSTYDELVSLRKKNTRVLLHCLVTFTLISTYSSFPLHTFPPPRLPQDFFLHNLPRDAVGLLLPHYTSCSRTRTEAGALHYFFSNRWPAHGPPSFYSFSIFSPMGVRCHHVVRPLCVCLPCPLNVPVPPPPAPYGCLLHADSNAPVPPPRDPCPPGDCIGGDHAHISAHVNHYFSLQLTRPPDVQLWLSDPGCGHPCMMGLPFLVWTFFGRHGLVFAKKKKKLEA